MLVGVLGGSFWSPLEWLRTPWHYWTQKDQRCFGGSEFCGLHRHWVLTTWQIPLLQTLTEKPLPLGKPLLCFPVKHDAEGSLKINERRDRCSCEASALPFSLLLGKCNILGLCVFTYAHPHMYLLVSSEIRSLKRFLSIGWILPGEFPQAMFLSNVSLISYDKGHAGPVIWGQPLSSKWWMRPPLHDHAG